MTDPRFRELRVSRVPLGEEIEDSTFLERMILGRSVVCLRNGSAGPSATALVMMF